MSEASKKGIKNSMEVEGFWEPYRYKVNETFPQTL
jgi:hypothetical protein